MQCKWSGMKRATTSGPKRMEGAMRCPEHRPSGMSCVNPREEERRERGGESKPSASESARPSSGCTFEVQGRTFWVEARSGRLNDEHYTSLVQRLEGLGAAVSKFLDVHVDCVVLAANPETASPSAPSTPTAGTSSASARGISARAQWLAVGDLQGRPMGSSGRLKSVSSSRATLLQPGPAQFAESHGKQVLSLRELLEQLQAAERREKRAACGFKRSRKECLPEGTPSLLPKTPRHAVRVRGSEVEFCKKVPGVPEWWHFPECDRHHYYGREETPDMASAASKVRSFHMCV